MFAAEGAATTAGVCRVGSTGIGAASGTLLAQDARTQPLITDAKPALTLRNAISL